MPPQRKAALFWISTAAMLLASRLAHRNILWADEDYHLAAAIQMLRGKMLYRDVWYDKPPLAALLDLLFGAQPGWPLRCACAVAALGVCWLGFKLAERLWGRAEGFAAAALLAFFQIFYLPSAVVPLEPDTLLLLPELAAVFYAARGRPFAAGLAAGVGLLSSPKGVFVLAPCFLFLSPPQWLRLLCGFALPNAVAALWLASAGALSAYGQQVWQWGWLYVSTPGADPEAQRGWLSIVDWLGFHAALALGAAGALARGQPPGWPGATRGSRADQGSAPPSWRLFGWAVIALASAALGGRFAPRYFNLLLGALAIPAARGLTVGISGPLRVLIALALLVPAVRFGPRYVTLAWEDVTGVPHAWQDVAMDRESRAASEIVTRMAQPGDTLFIWGYRPDVVVYTRLPVASKFWDSQPVTGVPADRHLSDARPLAAEWAARNRAELARTSPAFIVDGLSAYNPALDIHAYPDLASWLAAYCVSARTGGITVYRRCQAAR